MENISATSDKCRKADDLLPVLSWLPFVEFVASTANQQRGRQAMKELPVVRVDCRLKPVWQICQGSGEAPRDYRLGGCFSTLRFVYGERSAHNNCRNCSMNITRWHYHCPFQLT